MNTKELLPCAVVLLPTTKDSLIAIHKQDTTGELVYKHGSESEWLKSYSQHHLYFTSTDRIKKGDWYFWPAAYQVQKASEDVPEKEQLNSRLAKVEATSDKSLKLPMINNKFLLKYVQIKCDIKEVCIEVEWVRDFNNYEWIVGGDFILIRKVKVRRLDGSVIIHPSRTYSLEDMKLSFKAGMSFGVRRGPSCTKEKLNFDQWITNYNGEQSYK